MAKQHSSITYNALYFFKDQSSAELHFLLSWMECTKKTHIFFKSLLT